MNERIEQIKKEISPFRKLLLRHPVYQQLRHLDDLKVLMEQHVFAVWDFMALLKALQHGLTSTNAPWIPIGNPKTRRLINEIVLEEESDIDIKGNPASHYEMYLDAMEQCEANTEQVKRFIARLLSGYSHKELLKFNVEQIEDYTLEFVNTTFTIIHRGKLHEIAAAFTFGREDLIPDMFRSIVHDLDKNFPGKLDALRYYLDRHIQLDEEVHTPLAMQMIEELCGEDATKWQEAKEVAKICLVARIKLWDGIEQSIKKRQMEEAVSV
ncbi:DUF3050 domain-containing protein [bacterium]|jgi:hypothetical protein|nr:DUF3050 domain-containing protein [Flavobacteriales bacterium]MDA8963572.1 DUF3050 domain-containing protein [bacterium]